jgi:hypothetical protein
MTMIYGQPVRLFHQRTGQFVSPEIDSYQEDEGDTLAVHLEKIPSPGGVFRIFPIQEDSLVGTPVRRSDFKTY